MATRKKTPEEAWNAMREAQLDDLVGEIDAMSPEEVDAFLDANGGDSAGTRRRADAQTATLAERNARLGWQTEMRAKLEAGRAVFAEVRARRPKLSRVELEARVQAARNDPRFGAGIVQFFRKRTTAETTDGELEALLDEIEVARELAARAESAPKKPGGEGK